MPLGSAPAASGPTATMLRRAADDIGAGPLAAAKDARGDQVIEAGRDGAAGDADRGGQSPLGRDSGAFPEHPALDGIQQRLGQALVAGAGPLLPAAEHGFRP